MQNDVKPVPGGSTEKVLGQADMVVPAAAEIPGTVEENARQGGRVYTKGFEADECRPQDLHGSVAYQKQTADPGASPRFIDYTSLTTPRGNVRE